MKILLLRYFGQVDQAAVAQQIAKFLTDENKTVVIEALKAFKSLPVKFDASVLLPFIESMSEVEREMAIEVLKAQADAELVPKLAPWTCGKSEEIRQIFIRLFVKYVTPEGLEKYLKLLERQEWWGKEQSLKCLQKFGKDKLYASAESLTEHENEFIREQAQRFAAQNLDPATWSNSGIMPCTKTGRCAKSAIANLSAESNKRESIDILKKVVVKWPESAPAVLKAVA